MRILPICLILFGFCSTAYSSSKEPVYPAHLIPEELMKGANVVFRLYQGEFTIEKIDRGKYKVYRAITILNEKGDKHAVVGAAYNKLIKINSFSAHVFDKHGKEIYKLKSKDINDESNISSGTLYQDDRIQWVDLRQKEYPYTIEFEYELQFNYIFYIPDWYVIPGKNISVQKSQFTLSAPVDLKIRYKEINIEKEILKEAVEGENVNYQWTFENLKVVKPEAFSKEAFTPVIHASPSKFSYEGYVGDLSTWDGLAIWQNSLTKGRDILPPERIKEIQTLVADAQSIEERIRRIYHYMQKRTRYVSVQLGIGGFQPFEASVVDKTGNGDCKALVNYTQALLKAAGIKSYYTLVKAGTERSAVYENFSNINFNHVILCVPNKADTIWLECTSQEKPFGYLGKFTGDRKVLLISESKAHIVKTPAYDHKNNMISTHLKVNLDGEGNGKAILDRTYKGLGYEYNDLNFYLRLTDKDQKDWLYESLKISNYELSNYRFIEKKDRIPSVNLQVNMYIRKLATVSGKRFFLPLNFLHPDKAGLTPDEHRRAPVYLKYSSITTDTITFKLPKNLHIEFLPEETTIESAFGSYYMSITKTGEELTYYRTLKWNKGEYKATQYNELVDFYKNIKSADLKKVVLINKT